jgi:uncharacterized membrane protein YkvA (DUF1232 family)
MALLRFLSATRRALPRVLPLLRDVRVPFWLKAAAVGAALLVISPLDLFGDIPVIGLLDDALLLALLANFFVGAAARYARGDLRRFDEPMRRAAPVVYTPRR